MAKAGKRTNGMVNMRQIAFGEADPHHADDADFDTTKTKRPRSSQDSQKPAQLNDMRDSEDDPGHSTSV